MSSKKDWKKVQENTFTKWVNNSLKGHLTSSKRSVTDLKTDLADGIILAELLESLSKEKFRYTKQARLLKIKPQQVENLGASFKFMNEKGIKLVNIGPVDVYNEELKLILGLIWTLIRRFQIRSTGRALSTKDAMLAWINTQIPEQNIQNFTTDWNDGIALCALVDRIQPGLIPHFATLNASNKQENCALGMRIAEEKLDIPFLMDPEDLCHPEVDEISVMTYISYFTKLANAHLLHYIQATIPSQKITNFTSNWNNGINLACLLNALNPGGFSDWNSLDPHNALDNLSRGMNAAKEQLGIDPVLKPSQMADPNVDELNIVTYLSRFKNAKPLPQPNAITCRGDGLSKAVVRTPATFEVDSSRGGVGELGVDVTCSGKSVSAHIQHKANGIYQVEYTPESDGTLAIVIKWSGAEIPASPYSVTVVDPSTFSLSSNEITGKEYARVGETVTMEVKGFSNVSEVDIAIELSNNKTEKANVVEAADGIAKCSYIPLQAGVDKVVAKIAGLPVPGSPFRVKVLDPDAMSVALKEPKMNEPVCVNHKATFVVSSESGMDNVKAEFITPRGSQVVSLSPQGNSSALGTVMPVTSGQHEIKVTCGGDQISGSPISLSVYDPSKCRFKDSLPNFLHVGKPFSVDLSTDGAGEGIVEADVSDLGILTAETDINSNNDFVVCLNPKKVGDALIKVTWNGTDVPQCPHNVSVCDASKCSAFGPGLTSGKGKVNESFKFTVQVNGSGNGELLVTPKGPKTVYAANISKASSDTYDVSFTTFELGVHTIDIAWSGEPIPNSPYKVAFEKAISPTAFTVTGEGLKTAIALTPANIMIVGPESGLIADEKLFVSIKGMGLSSTSVGSRAEFEAVSTKPIVYATDQGNGAYLVEYKLPKAGNYTISVAAEGQDVPGSPFQVEALPEASAERCTVFGPAIDNPYNLVVSRPIEFSVDSTDAGTGELVVSAVDKNSVAFPVFLADVNRKAGKRIHAVKIDPNSQGTVKVQVQWGGKDIPKSPFSFAVNDPKSVVILDLPEPGDYTGRKGEEFSFSVDTRPAGSKGELKAAAKLDSGKVESFRQHQNPDGTSKFLFTPTAEGRMELLLTYCGVNILKTPWGCDVTDPTAFKVTIPKAPTKKGELVKFVITGLTQKLSKNITVTAKNNGHEATTKITFEQQQTAAVHFTAKEIGEYDVVVKAAKKHVTGSPFKCVVVDPNACVIQEEIPSILIVGEERTLCVDVSQAGPGTLTFECVGNDRTPSNAILSKVSGEKTKSVGIEGASCGTYTCSLKFAGFDIPGMPKEIVCTDPTKCSFVCDGISEQRCKTTSNIVIDVNTIDGGCCPPEVIAHGPKSKYDVEVKRLMGGRYSATVIPWQEGSNTIEVMVGGKDLSGSPLHFESFKPVDSSKITVSGPGLKEAVVNRPAQVIIHARESKLLDQGVLEVMLPGCDLEVTDQLNGSYEVSFVPKESGSMSMQVTGEGKDIPGSPFNISVLPEPDASKCVVKDRSGKEIFKNSREIYHLARTSFEVGVYTGEAGSGSLMASGLDPKKSQLQLFTNEGNENGERVSYIKFDPLSIGTYSLSLCWDDEELLGSPYEICVVDPSKCVFNTEFPSCIRIGEDISLEIDASKAGEGVVEACSSGPEVKCNVIKNMNGLFMVVLSGAQLGQTSIDLKFGGYNISDSSYPLSVCDPTKCTFDFEPGTYNVGKDFNIKLQSKDAGNAKFRVSTSKKCSTKVRNLHGSSWEINVTPKEVGEHLLNIFWGDWEVTGSPISFFACDPNLVQISGLPDPSEILILDVPVSFCLDHSEAGDGSITFRAQYSDGDEVDTEREETDGGAEKSTFSFIPRKPGKMTIILEYNNVSVIPASYEYSIPDPSSFSVVPPKGYGKVKEYVKFGITGVKDESEITISANHPEHDATVKTERSSADSTVLARFTPKQTGDYAVEVKLADQHVEGSPFTVQVANPDAVVMIGKLETVVHAGDEPNFQFDLSNAGPGELTYETEVVSGIEDTEAERESSWLVPLKDGVGKLKVAVKWAGYDIQGSPFVFAYVDSQKVTWSCEALEKDQVLKQGQLLNIVLDCSAAGDAFPVVTARGPEGEYPTSAKDNEDGTFTITLTPWQIGSNEVEILWGGKPIEPLKFEVMKNIDARGITASGDGLTKAVAKSECCITLNGIESGLLERGLLQAHFDSEENENVPPIEMSDEENGTYLLRFTPLNPEVLTLVIKYDDKNIQNSPFLITVLPAPDSDKCKAVGEAIEKEPAVFVANDPVKFTIDTTEAGTGTLKVSAIQPNNEPIRVYAVEESGLHHLKFDPVMIGSYTVEVTWCDADIPGSPFTFTVVDPKRCRITGVPLESSPVQANEKFNFSVDVKEVGDCSSCLEVKSDGATIVQETAEEDSDREEGLLAYTYEHDTVGKAMLEIMIAGVHVPGSPFPISIIDSTQFFIVGTNIEKDYAIVCEPVEIRIGGKPSEDDEGEELVVVAHGPSADLTVDVANRGDAGHVASFVPIEPGSYEVFVEFARRHVRGSPFTIKVADPSKCQILGRSPSVVHVGSREELTVKTRGAGEGKLEAATGKEGDLLSVELRDLGLDTYIVVLTGSNIGKESVGLKWGGYDIPKCPLEISICDASKCKALGGALATKKGKAGSVVSFVIETSGAGKAKLEVSAKGPTAQYTVNVVEKEEGKYEASFTPWEIGEHVVTITWGKAHIPESPFSLNIGSPLEMEVCNATGDGLEHAIAGRKATFTVLSSEVGLLDKNGLHVTVMGISSHAPVEIVDNNNGCYTVEYVAPTPGAYVATILFHGQNIPGSPFKLTAAPGPDASKCKVYGPALHPNALAIAGSPLEFFVDTAEAGHGELKVYIQGPNDYRPKVFMADDDQGVYSIKFDAMKAGKYFAVIVWCDQHIPKSPLKLRVHPAADASKVRAFGPGLIDGFIGAPGQFTIETKNAGIGTLLIRVHGLKDSFKIEARPLSEDDARTLITTYNPKLVGEYTVFVRWSGVHVPGSPFTVNIRQKPGVHDPSVEPPKRVKTKKKKPSTSSQDENMVHDSSIVKAPPDYDTAQEKRKRGRPSSTTSSKMSGAPQRSRPASTSAGQTLGAGPIVPSMKMRDNPAMAMALPKRASQEPGGYVSGIVQGEDTQKYTHTKVMKKKVVKKVVQKKKVVGRSSRSQTKKQTKEPPQRALSPGAVATSGVRQSRTTSPKPTTKVPAPSQAKGSAGFFVRQTKVTQQKVTSPERMATPQATEASTLNALPPQQRPKPSTVKPVEAAQPPPPQTAKSPLRKAVSPGHKAVSPGRKALSPGRKVSAHKAKSPAGKAMSPRRKPVPASRKAQSPAPKVAPQSAKPVLPSPKDQYPAPKDAPLTAKPVDASPKAQSPAPEASLLTAKPVAASPKAQSPAPKTAVVTAKLVATSQKAKSPVPKAAASTTKAKSPARKAVSPRRKAKPPAQRAVSPPPKSTSSQHKATSPQPKAPPKDTSLPLKNTSPPPKAVSASSKATSSQPKAPPKDTSLPLKNTSPPPKAVSASSKSTSPAPEDEFPIPTAPSKLDSPGPNVVESTVQAVHAVPVATASRKSEESGMKDEPEASAAVLSKSPVGEVKPSSSPADIRPTQSQGTSSGPSKGTKPTSPVRRVTSPPRKVAGKRVKSPPRKATSPVPKGGPQKKPNPSKAKSPHRRPPLKGKHPPPMKSAKK